MIRDAPFPESWFLVIPVVETGAAVLLLAVLSPFAAWPVVLELTVSVLHVGAGKGRAVLSTE